MNSLWGKCLGFLEGELPSQQFNNWIRPLQPVENNKQLRLLAPNRFVLDWVNEQYLKLIMEAVTRFGNGQEWQVVIEIGTTRRDETKTRIAKNISSRSLEVVTQDSNINLSYTFSTFVEGKSNQLARAVALQVGENAGLAFNPLFIYGGVGIGKTHLMHAVGNLIVQRQASAKVIYLHSERFVSDMVKALQQKSINDFKRFYRNVDVLLIDDIQFFAGKERSQEEFFHTFNSLLDSQRQVVMTCDRYPNELIGLEERLKSRFGWGVTVAVKPPELETRVAILQKKAEQMNAPLPNEVAFFIAKKIKSNVRELEGALRRVVVNSSFIKLPITLELAREALKDLLALQDKLVTIEKIQKIVAEYYQISLSDILSQRRNRSIARPRQLAMALAKELTHHSLPEIGNAFGGRDHATVLHACKKIEELRAANVRVNEDFIHLLESTLNA
ncbi:chromosomal replication initiator protein DnaA [Gammaproteobacteria bacterium]